MRRYECQAMLFDLDGVLLDSKAVIEIEWRAWAARHGLDPERVLEVAHGRRAVETIRMVAPHLDAEAEVRAAIATESADPAPVRALPGACRLLSVLPPDAWAVVTSTPRAVALGRLQRAGLPAPATLISAEDVRHGKPAPEAYLRAAEGLGAPTEECVVIEDAPPGIAAGRAAGMTVVALQTTHPPEALAGADTVVPDLGAVHLGRVNLDGEGTRCMEVLVVEG